MGCEPVMCGWSWADREKREVGAVRQANKDTWDKHMGRKIGTEMLRPHR